MSLARPPSAVQCDFVVLFFLAVLSPRLFLDRCVELGCHLPSTLCSAELLLDDDDNCVDVTPSVVEMATRMAYVLSGFVCGGVERCCCCFGAGHVCPLLQCFHYFPFRPSIPRYCVVASLWCIRYPRACTFSFATYGNPISQYLYECVTCDQIVCAVCAVSTSQAP